MEPTFGLSRAVVVRLSSVRPDKRIRPPGYDISCTMKALFSVFLAFGICVGSLQAGPAHRARNVARNSAITAKNIAHSVVKGTRRAVHTVLYAFTP